MNSNNQNFQKQTNQDKNQSCLQCSSIHPTKILTYMAQFNGYVCKSCYQEQVQMMLEYKKARKQLYPDFNEIQQGIYLGNQDAAIDQKTFQNTKISAVCVCGSYLMTPFQAKYKYKKYHIGDSPSQKILHLFEQNFQWIMNMKKQNRHILFHCAAGVSRSASFVIAYLMKSRNLSYLEAHKLVKSKRSIIYPNSGFVEQLYEYQKYLMMNKLQNMSKQQQNQIKQPTENK